MSENFPSQPIIREPGKLVVEPVGVKTEYGTQEPSTHTYDLEKISVDREQQLLYGFHNDEVYRKVIGRVFGESSLEMTDEDFLATVRSRNEEAMYLRSHIEDEVLPKVKEQIVTKVGARIGQATGRGPRGVSALLQTRLEGLKDVTVTDGVLEMSSWTVGVAQYDAASGRMELNLDRGPNAEIIGVSTEEFDRRNIGHESLHRAAVTGVRITGEDTPFEYHYMRGMAVQSANGDPEETGVTAHHGTQLEEGSIEKLRWEELDQTSPSYELAVMFWSMMDYIAPDIEGMRYDAQFFGENRGSLIGRIEELLGPMAIEKLEPLMRETKKQALYPDAKDLIVEMLPDDIELREKARAKLDEVEVAIFAPRGGGYSDEQLRQIKETGVYPDKPAYKNLADFLTKQDA